MNERISESDDYTDYKEALEDYGDYLVKESIALIPTEFESAYRKLILGN